MTLRIGLPQWGHPAWKRIGIADLADYARYFDCVEGNTTLYALPEANTVQRWRAMTDDKFSFCFKFPATISHQAALRDCQTLCEQFFRTLDPLQSRIGQYWLQLPASFAPQQLSDLWRFLATLPRDFSYGVEVRHRLFFAKGPEEQALNAGLAERGVNRVILDSRAVHLSSSSSAAALDAKGRKPKLPVHAVTTAQQPMIRFIGADEQDLSEQLFEVWWQKLTQWSERRDPLLFIHTPNMGEVFGLLQRLWPKLCQLKPGLPPLPSPPEQAQLF